MSNTKYHNQLADKLIRDFDFFMDELRSGNYYDHVIGGIIASMYSGKERLKMEKLQSKVFVEYEITFKPNKLKLNKIELNTNGSGNIADVKKFIKETYPTLKVKDIKKL